MIPRAHRPTCPNWKTFLRNHLDSIVSIDFLTVPTLTFQILYVFIVLSHHFGYYHRTRTHLALSKDAPEPRPTFDPDQGKIVAFAEVGGLLHRYERRAA